MKKKVLLSAMVLSMVSPNIVQAQTSPQEDFYLYVNQAWLDETEIPDDAVSVSAFDEIIDTVEDQLLADTKELAQDPDAIEDPRLSNYAKYYNLANDWEARNQLGLTQITPVFEQIDSLSSITDLQTQFVDLVNKEVATPVAATVMPAFDDATRYQLALVHPGTILPVKDYYLTPEGDQILQAYQATVLQLLSLGGIEDSQAQQWVADTIAFDQVLAQYARTAVESADVTLSNSPVSSDQVASLSSQVDILAMIQGLTQDEITDANLVNADYYQNIDQVLNEENLPLIKSWMKVSYLVGMVDFLTEEMREVAGQYDALLTGVQALPTLEESALGLAQTFYSEVLGLHYGQKYFGTQAKDQVTTMVEAMIDVYKGRISNNDWLSQATKDQALEKLDQMSIKVGYPDKIDPTYDLFVVDSDKTLVENTLAFNEINIAAKFDLLDQEVDRELWGVGAQTVNAFYNPQKNAIFFPAAFLQGDYYQADRPLAENYGAIGAVIAHEITHAFDPNGAKFDEVGNMTDWWTDQDYELFQEKSQAMIALWDGREYESGQVDGYLTLTENIADAGGLSAAYEAMMQTDQADPQAFFTAWARAWKTEIRPEMVELLLSTDTHAPEPLRANVQLSNFDPFYQAFEVQEGDGMYIAPEDRVTIW